MAFDLNDAWGWIQKIIARLSRLESGAMLENSSITNGRMRFIGGLLLIDSGGTLRVIGTVDGEGNFNWTGPWSFNSAQGGSISGDVDLAGDFDLTGVFKSGNVRIEDGKIYVGEGAEQIIIDGATGSITTGDVRIEDGRIVVGEGASQIVFDGETGTITVPGSNPIVLHQDNNGLARVEFGPTGAIWSGGDGVTIASGSDGAINVYSDGIDLVGDVHISPQLGGLPPGVSGKYMIIGSDGMIYAGSAGGGGGGDTPPNPFPGGYVWPADPAIYGISDDYGDHVARGSAEPGTDVVTPVGAAVYAPADGEVRAISTSPAGATGRLIVFRASNGAWFRFLHLSEVLVPLGPVAQGTVLGRTGGSGFNSEAYYGPHLHITYLPGPSETQPPLSSSTDFELVMAAQ